jgi:hypothetical protein
MADGVTGSGDHTEPRPDRILPVPVLVLVLVFVVSVVVMVVVAGEGVEVGVDGDEGVLDGAATGAGPVVGGGERHLHRGVRPAARDRHPAAISVPLGGCDELLQRRQERHTIRRG